MPIYSSQSQNFGYVGQESQFNVYEGRFDLTSLFNENKQDQYWLTLTYKHQQDDTDTISDVIIVNQNESPYF